MSLSETALKLQALRDRETNPTVRLILDRALDLIREDAAARAA